MTTPLSENHDAWLQTAENMVAYGGSFAGFIGKAMFVADVGNRQRIEDAFPEMLAKYGPDNWPSSKV